MMMHAMSDPTGTGLGVGVLPFDGMGIYEQPRPKFLFKMPRVVPDQKTKFENDELFRRLSRESEVKYTSHRDRPQDERQIRFQNGCREGHTEIAFAGTGTNLQLVFGVSSGNFGGDPRECDFEKEHGKVHIKSHLIMNGVCVTWRGYIDLDRLDGVGCLEFDEEHAAEEDALLREQIERYNRCMRDMEDKHRAYRNPVAAAAAAAAAGIPGSAAAAAAAAHHLNHHHHHHHHHHHASHHAHLGVPGTAPPGIESSHINHRQDPEMEVRLRAY